MADADAAARMRRRTWLLVALACLALALGTLVYLSDRDGSRATLIPTIGALAGGDRFGHLGLWLPSFVHPFAFGLLSAAALPALGACRYGACLAWCMLNLAFELGQHPLLSLRLAEALHQALGHTPLTHSLSSYFMRGTFDLNDVVAVILGSLAAAAVLRLLSPRSKEHRHEH